MGTVNFNKSKVDYSVETLNRISEDISNLSNDLNRAIEEINNIKGFSDYVGNISYNDVGKYVSNTEETVDNITSDIVSKEIQILEFDKDYDGINSVLSSISPRAKQLAKSKAIEGIESDESSSETVTVTFNYNDETGKILVKTINKGEQVATPETPVKKGYSFVNWCLNNEPYDFNKKVTTSITLKATYKETENDEIPLINYRFSSLSNGRWIFINNPEKLREEYLADKSGKSLYSSWIMGNAEIYFEHVIPLGPQNGPGFNAKFCIRFYNPSPTSVILKINAAGSCLTRSDGNTYIKTWKEYYKCKPNVLSGKSFNIAPYSDVRFYLNVTQTGTGWSDFDGNITTNLPMDFIPAGAFDGVLNVNSSGKLNVESFIFQDVNKIPKTSYDQSLNYVNDNPANKGVYSGCFDKLPFIVADINFKITENTLQGPLKVKYIPNSGTTPEIKDHWITHYKTRPDATKSDSNIINLTSYGPGAIPRDIRNWANWAVHYTENIIINNTTSRPRKIAYYVYTIYGSEKVASTLVAFSRNHELNYTYDRYKENNYYIGEWCTTTVPTKIWEIEVPANSILSVPTVVLLGGNCNGAIGRKVELI